MSWFRSPLFGQKAAPPEPLKARSVGFTEWTVRGHQLNHGGGLERERIAVQTAADHLTHEQIADAWRQARLGATAALTTITEAVGVRHRATYQDDDAIILVFQRGNDRCIALASRPGGNSVETRGC